MNLVIECINNSDTYKYLTEKDGWSVHPATNGAVVTLTKKVDHKVVHALEASPLVASAPKMKGL